MFSFSPSIFLTSKNGNFYKTLGDWNKRANLSNLSEEEQRLTAWIESEITSHPKLKIITPHMEFNGIMNGEELLYSLMKKASIVVFISNGMFD